MSEKTAEPADDAIQAPDGDGRRSFRGLSLRLRLLLLLALAILPAVVAGSIMALTRYEADLSATRAKLRALSILAVNRHLQTLAETNSLLQTVAQLPDIVSLDAGRCSPVLKKVHADLAGRYTNLIAVTPDSVVRCSALAMEPERRYSNPADVRKVLSRRNFTVGGVTVGGFSGERLVSAAAPIATADGAVVGVIATGIKASFLNSQFNAYQLPDGSQLALVDRQGEALLSAGSESWRLPAPNAIVAALASGRLEFQHQAGAQPYLVVLNEIGDYDMFVLAALPSEAATGPVMLRLMTDIGVILAFTLLAGIGILIGAQLLVLAPIARFRRAVRDYRRHGGPFRFPAGGAPPEIAELAAEFDSMARDVELRQDNMKSLLRQRDLLVRETNHRVKNNLQIVASLLSLQSRRISEPAAKMQFDLARQRVATLALLHRHLYEQRDTETVNLRSFFGQLVAQLLAAYGQRARCAVSVVDMRVPPSVAIPLGLIVTEAVTNAMKYAFPDNRTGRIELRVSIVDGRGHLVLQDDGVGMNGDDGGDRSGMGDILMRGFADQVSGELKVDEAPGGGTRIQLDFDPGEPPERPDAHDDTTLAG
ncbi:MAG: sensor histidine kinase [Reyranellaceae bacterium]